MNITLTLFGQMVTFAIFVWFCMKFVWPVILTSLEERQNKIEDGLNFAEKAARELAETKLEIDKKIGDAKTEASVIIDQANKRASQIVEEAKIKASDEGDRIKIAAQSEIDLEINRAKEKLRKSVSELAIVGAEKILEKAVDRETNKDLLDKLAKEL
jgi:F-type H+-transporting ATPase subunit b